MSEGQPYRPLHTASFFLNSYCASCRHLITRAGKTGCGGCSQGRPAKSGVAGAFW